MRIGSFLRAKAILAAGLFLLGCGALMGMSYYHFPHVANGDAGSAWYFTRFVITNGISTDNTIRLNFYQDNGSVWNLPLVSTDRPDISGTGNQFEFHLGAFETVVINTLDNVQLSVGWMTMKCYSPVVVSSGFTFYRQGMDGGPEVLTDVGVLPAPADTGFDMNVVIGTQEWMQGVDTNYGIAVSNPSFAQANLTFVLRNQAGQGVATETMSLGPRGHLSRFLTDLFPGVTFGESFHGSMKITGDIPFAPVALRVSNGLLSTIPFNRIVERYAQQSVELEPGLVSDINGLPAVITGTTDVSAGTDTDSYKLTLSTGTTLTVCAVAQSLGSTAVVDIELQNSSGQTLMSQAHHTGVDPEAIVYPITSSGNYFLIVRSASTPSQGLSTYKLFVDAH
jgi:hypothetical protein